ncbi:MAG: M28 family peptidase [Gemmatimonadetes bacterium]|nr:M28 family peptidase [Gemmatimonadota bacterium]
MFRRVFLLLATLLTASATPTLLGAQAVWPRHHTPQPTQAAITAADLMTRLYIFADDSMQGREMGTLGNVKGTDYIAAQLKRMGLEPAGDSGTYFQTVPYKTRTLDTASVIAVGSKRLALGTDWIPSSSVSADLRSVSVVYGGAFGDADHMISERQARGKLVVLSVPENTNFRALRGASVPGAAALALVTIHPNAAGRGGRGGFGRMMASFLLRPRGFVDDPDAPRPPGAPTTATPTVQISDDAAAALFSKPLDQLKVGASGRKASIHIRYRVEPAPFPSRNVVAIARGSDPQLAGEYVAIGAHNDHLGFNHNPVAEDSLRIFNHIVRPEGADDGRKQATPEQQAQVNTELAAYRALHPGPVRMDSIYNGADDDGSGSVTELEIAEKVAAMNPRPKRSILFVWHVGEEKGLLGSTYFTDHPTVPLDSIVAQLNMDMVGRGDADDETGRTKDGAPVHGGPGYVELVGSRRLSTELGDLIERVNTEDNHNLVFDYVFDVPGHPSRIYCRSDHYEYARWGIPITFFTTGLHSDYHQVSDEPEYIDYAHMAQIGNLVWDVAVHVADLNHRLVVDQPKPDPFGVCR